MSGAEATPDGGFVEIDEAECRRRLRDEGIGVLATLRGDHVEARPVNYALHRARLVVRTDRGMLFDAAKQTMSATLVVMSADPEHREAWSVIVKGHLSPADAEIQGVGLFPWAASEKAECIALAIDEISGRQLR